MDRKQASQLVDPPQAADLLSISIPALRALVRRGRIPYVKLGPARNSIIRFDLCELERWINQHRRGEAMPQ